MDGNGQRELPAAPELERLLAEIVEVRMGQACPDVIAYELWEWMSRRGVVEVEELNAVQREVAKVMVRVGLVQDSGGQLTQSRAAMNVDRWDQLR